MKKNTLNARNDTIHEKSSFKNLIGSKRCLVYLKGFYESYHKSDKEKFPFYIYNKDKSPFCFAGIYDTRIDKETGETHNHVSIVTTDANPFMAKIHNSAKRMPVVLEGDNKIRWFLPDLSNQEISSMLIPYNDEEKKMEAYTVGKYMYKKKEDERNVEAAKERVEYPELAGIDFSNN